MAGIFISYRRDDAAGWAGRLTVDLRGRFPADKVFQDISTIAAGDDFVAGIDEALSSCTVALVMIGPHWLEAESGAVRRLDDPRDMVRLEIVHALRRPDVRVIPLLVGGAQMPRETDLPDNLKPLTRRNAFELSDTRWDYDLERLTGELVKPGGIEHPAWWSPGLRKGFASAAIALVVVMGAGYAMWRVQQGGLELGRETHIPGIQTSDSLQRKADKTESNGSPVSTTGQPFPLSPSQSTTSVRPDPASGLEPGSPFRDCGDCPEMVVLPPGEFMMGSSRKEKGHRGDEAPRHRVHIAYRLAVGKFEVTRGQFMAFANETGYESRASCRKTDLSGRLDLMWEDPALEQDDTHPVVCVNWPDSQAYVKWLSTKTGRVYRLLSESEWEYAARAGSDSPFYWATTYKSGVHSVCAHENLLDQAMVARFGEAGYNWNAKQSGVACSDGHVFTAPVGTYKPNAFGLYDMGGNVREWVLDCRFFADDYADVQDNGAPISSSPNECGERGNRGGSWWQEISVARSANRGGGSGHVASPSQGFRVAREF